MSRTQVAIKNTAVGIMSKIISLILGFVSRTAFIYILGNQYLGINGLYTEVLSVLSFAELGFGVALTYAMYKPVAENDKEKIVKLINYYKKVYRMIAGIVALLGMIMLLFLPYIVNGADSLSLFDLRLYYLIFLFNTIISYFISYKYSVVNALQKNYVITTIEMMFNFVIISAQIIVLLIFKSFLLYLLTQSVLLLCSKVFMSLYLNKKFPVLTLKTTSSLSEEEKAPIIKDVKGLIIHQFSSIAVHSTDNIIISMFSGMGVVAVGLVSNYNLLISSVVGFIVIIFSSVTSGFGNMVALSDTENYHKTFLELNFLNFWMYGFCSIAFFILIPPFITLWIGPENQIDIVSFLLIVINCYLVGQSSIYNNARIAKGNFNKDKCWALAQALVNLVVSVICAKSLGLVGVYIGTVASRLVYIIFRPFSTYKFLFNKSAFGYYKKLILYFVVTVIACILAYISTRFMLINLTIAHFSLACLIVCIIPNLIFILLFHRSNEFKNLIIRLKNIMGKGGSKNVT